MISNTLLLQKQREKLKSQISVVYFQVIQMASTKMPSCCEQCFKQLTAVLLKSLLYLLKMFVSYTGTIMKDMTDENQEIECIYYSDQTALLEDNSVFGCLLHLLLQGVCVCIGLLPSTNLHRGLGPLAKEQRTKVM